MKATEIIAANARKKGQDPKYVLKKINMALASKKAFLLKQNDSVLLCVYIGPHAIETHIYTEDSPLALLHALKVFIAKIKNSHIDVVYGNANNPGIIKLLKTTGLEVEHSDIEGYNFKAVNK